MSEIAPFKAENLPTYTCGNCLKIFNIKRSAIPSRRLITCEACGRKYSERSSSGVGGVAFLSSHPLALVEIKT